MIVCMHIASTLNAQIFYLVSWDEKRNGSIIIIIIIIISSLFLEIEKLTYLTEYTNS